MPYTDSGLIPDVIFNPHGSIHRMVINTFLENYISKLNGYLAT